MITVLGEPVAKARPRVVRKNGRTMTFTPQKTVNYETLVKFEYLKQKGVFYENGMLRMVLNAFYKIPKSFSKSKRNQALRNEIRPTVKPDLDNVVKCVCDALNGEAYTDDNQIVELIVNKFYAEQPRVEFELSIV